MEGPVEVRCRAAKTEMSSDVISSARYPMLAILALLLWLLAACGTEPQYRLQYVCLHRSLQPCIAAETFAERVSKRTDGRVEIEIVSYSELESRPHEPLNLHFSPDNSMELVAEGKVVLAEIIPGGLHILYMDSQWGMYDGYQTQAEVTEAIREDVVRIIEKKTGAVVLAYQFYPSGYYFSKKPLRTAGDMRGLDIRSHSIMLTDLLDGMGAAPLTEVGFSQVYTMLESGKIDAAISCSSCGSKLRWYEPSGYLVGPIVNLSHSWIIMNRERLAELPSGIQEVIREEALRLEELTERNALTIWDQQGVRENIDGGMEHFEMTPELKELARRAAIDRVLPEWVKRVGGPTSEAVRIFNEKAAPILKVEITPDGKARELK